MPAGRQPEVLLRLQVWVSELLDCGELARGVVPSTHYGGVPGGKGQPPPPPDVKSERTTPKAPPVPPPPLHLGQRVRTL